MTTWTIISPNERNRSTNNQNAWRIRLHVSAKKISHYEA